MQLPGQNVTFRSYFQIAHSPSRRLNHTVNSYLTLPHAMSHPIPRLQAGLSLLSPDNLLCVKTKGHVKNCSQVQQHFLFPAFSAVHGCCGMISQTLHFTLTSKGDPLVQTCSLLKPRNCSSVMQNLWFLLSQIFALLSSAPGTTNPLATGQISLAVASARISPIQPNLALALQGRDGKDRTYPVPHRHVFLAGKTPWEGPSTSIWEGCCAGLCCCPPWRGVMGSCSTTRSYDGSTREPNTRSLLGKITSFLQYNNPNGTWGVRFFQGFVPTRNSLSYLQLVHWRSRSCNNKYHSTCV